MKKFLKQFYGVILGIFLLGVVFGAPALKQWNNSKFELSQYRMLFTDTGLPGGTPILDINTGGNIISYGSLLDGELNPYITGYTETDPIFTANSGDYIPYTSVDTGFNNTGSDTIIPSEKAVWGLVDNLTQSYIPYRSGDKMYDSPMYNFPGMGVGITGEDNGLHIWDGGVKAKYGNFYNADYHTGITDGNFVVVRANKYNTGWLFGGMASNYAMGMFLSNGVNTPNSYAALSIGPRDIANLAITNSSGSNFRVDFGGNMEVKGTSTFSENVYITGGASLYDAGGNKYITGLGYMGLTNNYIPYRSGDRFYNSNAIFNYSLGRLELGGRNGVINYSGVAMIASGGAYFDGDGILGGFSIPVGSGAGMFGGANGTGKYAGYLQSSANAVGLGIDAHASSTAGIFTSQFGQLLDLTTINGTGISINKMFTTYTGGIALNIGYSGLSNMTVDYSGNISTVGNQTFDNGTDMPFRFAYSGGLMEGQYFTGGTWVSAVQYTLP